MPESIGPESFDVQALATVTLVERFGWYTSDPIYVAILGANCWFNLDGYAEDDGKAEFHEAIANFRRLERNALYAADEALFRYYKDNEGWWMKRGEAPLGTAAEAWRRVTLGHEPIVVRRTAGDRAIYISIECECAWEEEHGLQLVFKNSLYVNKLGSYDGHLTNAEAYADKRLEDVIYHS